LYQANHLPGVLLGKARVVSFHVIVITDCKGGTRFTQKQLVGLVGTGLQWLREDGNKITLKQNLLPNRIDGAFISNL
jgi:hypothetical protein